MSPLTDEMELDVRRMRLVNEIDLLPLWYSLMSGEKRERERVSTGSEKGGGMK